MFKLSLEPGEELISMYRKSEAVLFKSAFIVCIFIYVPWWFLLKYGLAGQYRGWLFLLTVLAVAYAVNAYVLWLLNVSLLTTRRVIVVTYHNIIHKRVSEAPLAGLINVGYTAKGVLAFAFGFGNVELQLHGQTSTVEIPMVREPAKVQTEILRAAGLHRTRPSRHEEETAS